MAYRLLKNEVKTVNVFYGRNQFRKYLIEVESNFGEIFRIFQNQKPSIKDQFELAKKYYRA